MAPITMPARPIGLRGTARAQEHALVPGRTSETETVAVPRASASGRRPVTGISAEKLREPLAAETTLQNTKRRVPVPQAVHPTVRTMHAVTRTLIAHTLRPAIIPGIVRERSNAILVHGWITAPMVYRTAVNSPWTAEGRVLIAGTGRL